MAEFFAVLAFLAAAAALVVAVMILMAQRQGMAASQASSNSTPALMKYIGDEFLRSRQEIAGQVEQMRRGNEQKLDQLRLANEQKLDQMRLSSEQKLDQMRGVVDEKLQRTLERRLAESFKTVSEHLDQVQQGLGEMKTLAADVGGLKKALTNVKIRGTFGEVQLERILEQMLHPGQYEKNAATKPGSQERVEFALRLPGTDGQAVLLPMDSKFPAEDYERLLEGMEAGDKEVIEAARKALALRMRLFAKDIRQKYIAPPATTDFAILFLPTEGLYAEVAQNPALFESLQRDYHVTITGPTTLAAYLNALQMGFKTLAIEQRSVEVWKVLGAVKAEFETFAAALDSAQKKIRAADNELDNLVGRRTNVMARKLREVERLPDASLLE